MVVEIRTEHLNKAIMCVASPCNKRRQTCLISQAVKSVVPAGTHVQTGRLYIEIGDMEAELSPEVQGLVTWFDNTCPKNGPFNVEAYKEFCKKLPMQIEINGLV